MKNMLRSVALYWQEKSLFRLEVTRSIEMVQLCPYLRDIQSFTRRHI